MTVFHRLLTSKTFPYLGVFFLIWAAEEVLFQPLPTSSLFTTTKVGSTSITQDGSRETQPWANLMA